MSKTGIRKGKDFIKNMEKLKKIYGGKIPKNLTIDDSDKTLKKVTPIKKNSCGGLTEGIKSVKAKEKKAPPSKKPSQMQGTPSIRASQKQAPKSKKASDIPLKKLTGGQAKLDKNKNDKIDAEDFKLLREGAFSGSMISKLSSDVIGRAFPKVKGQKQKEEEMYMREKAKYDKPQNMRGGGIAIKGTKFKGVF